MRTYRTEERRNTYNRIRLTRVQRRFGNAKRQSASYAPTGTDANSPAEGLPYTLIVARFGPTAQWRR